MNELKKFFSNQHLSKHPRVSNVATTNQSTMLTHQEYETLMNQNQKNNENFKKSKSKCWGVLLGATAASLTIGSVYFLSASYYGTSTPLHLFFDAPPQDIRIEYYLDDMPSYIAPDTPEWQAFHDDLLTEAGYDAATVRANANIDVSFVAYDDINY